MFLISEIFKKDHLKIIVTDSGLGGLSVQALLDKKLREINVKPKIDLIFYNSLADHNYGYNTMPSESEKLRVFDLALNGMLKFNPDIILIACNTLTAIYPKTTFSKKTKIQVLGIIDLGIELFLEESEKRSESNIILFGTETTILSNQHKNKLLAKGVVEKRIISQPCKDLESEIQIDPNSVATEKLIEKFVKESYQKVDDTNAKNFAVFCCTHYGYSKSKFQNVLNEIYGQDVIILNPNEKMADVVVHEFQSSEKNNSEIINQVYSKVDVDNVEMRNLSELLAFDSPSTADAFLNYLYDKTLFDI